MPNGLADNFEIAHPSIDGLVIRVELFERQTFDVSLDLGDCIEDVFDAAATL